MLRKILRALALACLGACAIVGGDLAWLAQSRATITSTTNKVTLLGNGAQTVFAFSFVGVAASDITVIYTDAAGNQTTLTPTQYSVVLNAATPGQTWGLGGTVTYPLTGSPIANGTTLTILRSIPLIQTTSLNNQGALFPKTVETALDLLTMQMQQVSELFSRALVASPSDTCTPGTLPAAAARANQLIGFDGTGCNPLAVQPATAPVSSAMQPVVAAASTAQAVTLLGISNGFTMPIGAELDWPNAFAPQYWHLEDGSTLSRASYPELFAILAPVVSCAVTSGSATVTGIGSSAYPGLPQNITIEGPGFAAGTTITTVNANSIVVNPAATGNASQCQPFLFGNGNGSTTYTLPNATGRAYVGLDTAQSIISASFCGGSNPAWLGAVCGSQQTVLTQANLPALALAFASSATYAPGTLTVNTQAGNFALTGNTGAANIAVLNGAGTTLWPGTASVTLPNFTPAGVVTANGSSTLGSGAGASRLMPLSTRNKIIFLGRL